MVAGMQGAPVGPILEMKGIVKRFGGVTVLKGVDLVVRAG
jgi:ABC-type sugar transport system ATPase subunit